MALQGSVPVTTLERTVSNDFTQAQDLINRTIAEMASAMVRTVESNDASLVNTVALRTSVSSGLNAYSGGAAVFVSIGILMQSVAPSPPDVPAPDTFDSDYRVGLQMAIENAGDPWDATNAWWLLEARVVRVTTLSENRDIFNPATLTFAPSAAALDKRYESQIEFQWTKGTATTLPAATAGWAPIAGCYRAAVYAAIAEADVIPLNLQLEDLSAKKCASGHAIRTNFKARTAGGIGDNSSSWYFDFAAEVGGVKLHARTLEGLPETLKSTIFTAAADVAALNVADTWGYVYLAPYTDMCPKKHFGRAALNIEVNGILVLSRTPPTEHGVNSAAIIAPDPLAVTIPQYGAAHVGLVLVAGGAGSCQSMNVSEKGRGRIAAREFLAAGAGFTMNAANSFGSAASPYNLAVGGAAGTEDVPYGVKLCCFLEHTNLDTTSVAKALETTFGLNADNTGTPTLWPRMMLDTDTLMSKEFMLHPNGALSLSVAFVPRTAALANSGGGAADGGTTVERAGMHGFEF